MSNAVVLPFTGAMQPDAKDRHRESDDRPQPLAADWPPPHHTASVDALARLLCWYRQSPDVALVAAETLEDVAPAVPAESDYRLAELVLALRDVQQRRPLTRRLVYTMVQRYCLVSSGASTPEA